MRATVCLRHFVADFDREFLEHAGRGRRYRWLPVRFQCQQGVFRIDARADRDADVDGGTSWKLPMSGTLTSMICSFRSPDQTSARRMSASNCATINVKARCQRAVDDAMVGGERQRQVRRGRILCRSTGFIADLETPRMATSGALTIGENAVPPMPPTLEW